MGQREVPLWRTLIKLILLTSVTRGSTSELDIHITMGIQLEPEKRAVMVENTIPIMFKLPNVDLDVSNNIVEENLCKWGGSHIDEDGRERSTGQRGCQLSLQAFKAFKINREMLLELKYPEDLARHFHRWERESGELSRSPRGLVDPLGDVLEVLTGVPSAKTFKALKVQQDQIEKFVEKVAEFQKKQNIDFIRVSEAQSLVTKRQWQVSIRMRNEIVNMTRAFRVLQKEYDDADLAIANTNLVLGEAAKTQGMMLHYLYATRARDTCASQRIPRLMLDIPDLRRSLEELRKGLDQNRIKMAIPDYDLELYYKLPLAECIWEAGKGLLKVQVPTVPVESEWKLFRVQAVPYTYHNQTCYLDIPTTYVAVNGKEVRPLEERDFDNCQIDSEFLCMIPKYGMINAKRYQCIIKLIKGASIAELQKLCPVDCHNDTDPQVTLVGPRRYTLTNIGNNRASVQCEGIATPLTNPPIGAITVNMPCSCQLIIDSRRYDKDYFPCVAPSLARLEVNHTIPAIWTTEFPDVKIYANRPILIPVSTNLSAIVNPETNLYLPEPPPLPPLPEPINYTEIFEMVQDHCEELHPILSTPFVEKQFHQSHYLMYGWVFVLTCLVGYLFVFYRPIHPPLRIAAGPVVMSALGTRVEGAKADYVNPYLSKTYTVDCVLPAHLEVLLWIYFAWIVIVSAPYLIVFIRKQWNKYALQKELAAEMKRQAASNPVYQQCSLRSQRVNRNPPMSESQRRREQELIDLGRKDPNNHSYRAQSEESESQSLVQQGGTRGGKL